jgi:hypothetical protein
LDECGCGIVEEALQFVRVGNLWGMEAPVAWVLFGRWLLGIRILRRGTVVLLLREVMSWWFLYIMSGLVQLLPTAGANFAFINLKHLRIDTSQT